MGESDGSAAVWSIGTRHEVVALLEKTGAVDKIAFSPDTSEVATASEDGIVRIWHTSGPELDDVYLQGSIEERRLVRRASCRRLCSRRSCGDLQLADVGTGTRALCDPGQLPKDIVSLAPKVGTSPMSLRRRAPRAFVPVGSEPQSSTSRNGTALGSYRVPGAEAITWSHDGREIAVASTTLEIVNLATGQATPLTGGGEQCGEDGPAAFSANNSLVAWATCCGTSGSSA